MGQPNMRKQGLQSIKNKNQDKELENKCKANVVFYTTVDPNTTKEGNFNSELCGRFPSTPNKVNKYIYGFYAILTTAMKNIIDKKMVRAFKELTTDFKSRGINR